MGGGKRIEIGSFRSDLAEHIAGDYTPSDSEDTQAAPKRKKPTHEQQWAAGKLQFCCSNLSRALGLLTLISMTVSTENGPR